MRGLIARLCPCPDQVRYYAETAVSAYETLEPEEAEQYARSALADLIDYLDALDAADDSVSEKPGKAIKVRITSKLRVRDLNS